MYLFLLHTVVTVKMIFIFACGFAFSTYANIEGKNSLENPIEEALTQHRNFWMPCILGCVKTGRNKATKEKYTPNTK